MVILFCVLVVTLSLSCGESKEAAPNKQVIKKEEVGKKKAENEGKEETKVRVKVMAGRVEADVAEGSNKAAVEGLLREKTVEIQRCYYEWVKKNGGKEGSLVFGITLDTDGSAKVEVLENSVDDVVATCASGIVREISFPKPAQKVTFKIPFKFSSL